MVLAALTAPPAEAAMEKAAAVTLSGISRTAMTSYSPNDMYAHSILPPNPSTAGRIASIRFCGFLSCAAQASGVYATWSK